MSYYQGIGSQFRQQERRMTNIKKHMEEMMFKLSLNLKDPLEKQIWDGLTNVFEIVETAAIQAEDNYNNKS